MTALCIENTVVTQNLFHDEMFRDVMFDGIYVPDIAPSPIPDWSIGCEILQDEFDVLAAIAKAYLAARAAAETATAVEAATTVVTIAKTALATRAAVKVATTATIAADSYLDTVKMARTVLTVSNKNQRTGCSVCNMSNHATEECGVALARVTCILRCTKKCCVTSKPHKLEDCKMICTYCMINGAHFTSHETASCQHAKREDLRVKGCFFCYQKKNLRTGKPISSYREHTSESCPSLVRLAVVAFETLRTKISPKDVWATIQSR
jgi:hypothetical protein